MDKEIKPSAGKQRAALRWAAFDHAGAQWAERFSLAFAIGALAIFMLLILGQLRLWQLDDVGNPAAESLRQISTNGPDREMLAKRIQELDRLARQSYFNQRQWVTRASWLVFIFVGLALALWRWSKAMAPKTPPLPLAEPPKTLAVAQRGAFIGLGLILLLVGVVLGFWGRAPAPHAPAPLPASAPIPETLPGPVATPAPGAPTQGNTPPAGSATPHPGEYETQWPSFRGPYGRGMAPSATIPIFWDGPSRKGLVWKVALGAPGQSSPCLWKDQIFISGFVAGIHELACHSAKDGALLWRRVVASGAPPAKTSGDTGGAPATPSTDGHVVAVTFPNGEVACFDLSGKPLWQRNLGAVANAYGYASSPLVFGHVYIQFDVDAGGMALALDSKTGVPVWRSARKSEASWASPILIPRPGGLLLVTLAAPGIWANDPVTGAQVFALSGISGELAPSPAWGEGVAVAAQEYAPCLAFDAAGKKMYAVEGQWPNTASPVVAKGSVFLVDSHGGLTVLGLQDGKTRHQSELSGEYYSSPVAAGGRVIFINRQGQYTAISASTPFDVLAQNQLGEGVSSTPALQGGKIFIRGEKHLFCFTEGTTP